MRFPGTATSFTIRDRRALSPDGTDHVTGVENFQFADRTMDAETLKDHTPPQVTSTFPADESTVPYDTIGPTVIHFSEPITHGIGQIEVDGFGPSLIDQSDFTISGDTLTIDTGFAAGQSYTVTLPIGVIQDAAGNAFDGGSFSYSVENLPSYGLGTTAIQVILGTNIIANDVPLDMAAWDPAQLADGTVTFGSATQVNILGATDGLTYELFGDFFWFDGPSYGDLAADDLSSIAVFDNGSGAHHLLYLISNLQGLLPNEDALHGLDPDVVANNGLGFWLDEWSGNSIAGSSASDNLFGREGNDSLDGLNGNDTLTGSEGNDIIAGGAGADLLTGGIGVDTFQVSKISDLVAGDEITDLEPGDVIDLSAIAGLSFIGSAAFSGIPGQLNYLWNGGQTILQIDSNGDRIADAFLNLDGGQFVLGETSAGSEKLHIVGGVPSPSLVEVSSAPTYGAPNPTFELQFDQNMQIGSGIIEIHNGSDGSLVGTLQLDSRSLGNGRSVFINANSVSGLHDSIPYYIVFAPGALRSQSGLDFAGISDPSTLTFSGGDTGPPKFLGSSPSVNATNVPVDSDIVLTFSEPVKSGSGTIFLKDLTSNQTDLLSTDDSSQVTYSGNQVIIDPASDLEPSHRYELSVSPGGIRDFTGNAFTDSVYDFFDTPDLVPPALLVSSLSNGAFGVNPFLSGFTFSFDKAVTAGSGFIEIRKTADGSLVSKIDIADPTESHFQLGGGYVDIRFPPTLDFGTTYSVTIDPGAIENLSGVPFAGLSSPMTFTTATLDQFGPVPIAFSPANHDTGSNPSANIVLTFSRDVIPATGDIIIHRASDQSVAARIAITDSSQVKFDGNIVTINPVSNLDKYTAYNIEMPFGLVYDHAGNAYLGTASTTDYSFTTAASPPFYLPDSNGLGPSLKVGGADVIAGQFGAWAPIAAEKTSNGYEIAWKNGNADTYTLWAADANGNYTGNLIGNVPGSDATLQSAETLFQQDLNGDGTVGLPTFTPIETHGATTLATADNRFYLQDSVGNGPVLSSNGANVLAGQFGVWTPIGAEKTSSGYEIAWKSGSADLYTLWATDANGNYTGNLIGNVSGSDATLQSAETLFHQDLNGDGTVGTAIQGNGQSGPVTIPIETHGATTLGTAGNQFYLQDSTGAGPALSVNGANVVAGQFGVWTPIAAEKTGSGYEIAWKSGSADLYTLWATDANGKYTGNLIGNVTGADPTLQSAEALFHQDLNGDGTVGIAIQSGQSGPFTTPIETHGVTTLGTAGNQFYLQDSTGAGPILSVNGTNVLAGQFGAWTPIAAEKTSSGYEIAWKSDSADLYTLWATDANGNYTGNLIGNVSGSDTTLQSAESLFQQDLNGDGTLGTAIQSNGQPGPITTPIETHGVTTLGTAGNHFYLQDSTGNGPVLSLNGADVVTGQFGAWAPIGAEKTSTGYEIAWKNGSADLYTLWATDAHGNYSGNLIGNVSGAEAALQSAETLFQQDLNQDGHFGLL